MIPINHQDYLDAARAYVERLATRSTRWEATDSVIADLAANPVFVAAVDAAFAAGYRAGYGQGRDDEAGGEDLPS